MRVRPVAVVAAPVDHRVGRLVHAVLVHVADDADDAGGRPWGSAGARQRVPDRIAAGKEAIGERARDKGLRLHAPGLLRTAGVTLKHRNVKRLEVPGADRAPIRKRLLIGSRADDLELGRRKTDAGRQLLARRRRFDTRNRLEPCHRPPLARDDGVERFGPGGAHAERLHTLGIESRRRRLQPREAADQQARADQQDDGERDLRGDQGPLHGVPPAGVSASAASERAGRTGARSPERRRNREKQGRQQSQADREGDEAGVDANLLNARQGSSRLTQQRRSPVRDHEAERGSDQRQDQPFYQQLLHHRRSRRAQREAHGELMLAPRRLRQQQAGDVAARGQQDQGDGARQEPQRSPDASDLLFLQGRQRHGPALVGIRKLLAETRLDRGEVGLRLLDGDAGCEPSDGRQEPRLTRLEQHRRHLRRHPRLRRRGWIAEGRRHDADDGAAGAGEDERPADDSGIGVEARSPEAVADHDRSRPAHDLLGRGQRAPERGGDAEDAEKTRRRPHRLDALGNRAGRLGHVLEVAAGQVRKGAGRALPFLQPSRRDELGGSLLAQVQLVDGDEPIGRGIRQRLEQHGVHRREDRAVRADAEGQGEDNRDGHSAAVAETAHGGDELVAHVALDVAAPRSVDD